MYAEDFLFFFLHEEAANTARFILKQVIHNPVTSSWVLTYLERLHCNISHKLLISAMLVFFLEVKGFAKLVYRRNLLII
jgi:hypothetical protein